MVVKRSDGTTPTAHVSGAAVNKFTATTNSLIEIGDDLDLMDPLLIVKQLDITFNITPEVEVDSVDVKEPVGIQKPPTKDDVTRDYEYTRGNLYSIIEKGQEAIDGILELHSRE